MIIDVDGWIDNFKEKENAKQIIAKEVQAKTFVPFLLHLYFPPLYLLVESARNRSCSENIVL